MPAVCRPAFLPAGLTLLQDLNLQGCRNLANAPGLALSGLGALHYLTSLCMRGCDRLAGAGR